MSFAQVKAAGLHQFLTFVCLKCGRSYDHNQPPPVRCTYMTDLDPVTNQWGPCDGEVLPQFLATARAYEMFMLPDAEAPQVAVAAPPAPAKAEDPAPPKAPDDHIDVIAPAATHAEAAHQEQ